MGIIAIILLLVPMVAKGATITSKAAGGDWTKPSTWVNNKVPTAEDNVVIATTNTNNVNYKSTGNQSTIDCASLVINSGSILLLDKKSGFWVSGSTTNAGSILWVSNPSFFPMFITGDLVNSGTLDLRGPNQNGSSTLKLTGGMVNTGTLIFETANVYFIDSNSATSSVDGFTTNGSIFMQRTAGSVVFAGNVSGKSLIVSGNGGTLNLGIGHNHTIPTDVSVTAGTLNGGSSTLNVGGNWTINGGTFTPASSTINFYGATVATIGASSFNNVTFSDSGVKTAGGDFTIIGNWINNNINFNLNSKSVSFIGSGPTPQTIGGTVITSFNNITINNIGPGVTLGNNETVTETLNLIKGLITTGSNTITVTNPSSGSITGASVSSYVNGKLARVYTAIGSKIFPIGKGGNYRPLNLEYTALTGTSTVAVEQIEGLIPGTFPQWTRPFALRYWTISQSGGSAFSFKLTLDGTGWWVKSPNMLKGDGNTNKGYPVTHTTDLKYTNVNPFTEFGNFGLGGWGIYWIGTGADNKWSTPENWSSSSVPVSTDCIYIPQSVPKYPLISGVKTTNDVTIGDSLMIADGATVTLDPGPVMTIQPEAILVQTAGNAKIILNSGSTYLNLSSSTPRLEVKREFTGTKGWRMVASPVPATFGSMFQAPLVTQGFTGSTYPALQPNLLWWDETDGGTTLQGWRKPSSMTENMVNGKGYFHYLFNGAGIIGGGNYLDLLPQTISLTGIENYNGSGNFSYNLTYTPRNAQQGPTSSTDTTYYDINSLDQGWNLIGNPTASTLDWDITGSAWTKTYLDNTIYVWDPSANGGNGDYLAWNGTTGVGNGKIAPFQAFWVHANAASPLLSFNNAAKSNATSIFTRSESLDENISVPITLTADQMKTTSFISFENNGVVGPDNQDGYRLEPMNSSWLELFTLSSSKHVSPLVINNLPPLSDNSVISIPLYVGGVVDGTGINGNYTLQWQLPDNWPSGWYINLQDNRNSKVVSMNDNAEYTFNYATPTTKSVSVQQSYIPGRLIRPVSQRSLTRSNTELPPFSIVISKVNSEYLAPIPRLLPNYPNPFRESTAVRFSLPEGAHVRICLYDLRGTLIDVLTDADYPSGFTEIQWQAGGKSPGVYLIRFISGDTAESRKMILMN
ncbi:hypothetical protein BSYN_16420 [Bacteroides sedimenti]|uniref:T9SS type A sorting domain-containing protein n=2 Tax=Bacteroides sedimenti TaxID=2136147 RepID=A0ABM8IBK1_9BACE